MELFYYGVLPYGLPLLMVAAAVALRPPDADQEDASSPTAAAQPAAIGPPGLTSTGRGP